MVAYFGIKLQWPSALIIYWLSFNVFSMAQQFYLMRRHRPLVPAGAGTGAVILAPKKSPANGVLTSGENAAPPVAPVAANGARTGRKRRSSRR
jgi:membrane protein insertase Oxa1/YidC/SpoIIIJ